MQQNHLNFVQYGAGKMLSILGEIAVFLIVHEYRFHLLNKYYDKNEQESILDFPNVFQYLNERLLK